MNKNNFEKQENLCKKIPLIREKLDGYLIPKNDIFRLSNISIKKFINCF